MTDFPLITELSYGVTMAPTLRTRSIQFGDHRSQTEIDGLNPARRVWNVTWTQIKDDDAKSLIDEFIDGGGSRIYEDFDPLDGGDTLNVRVTQPNRAWNGWDNNTVTAIATECFDAV